jgi:hypothetical protein
VINTTIAGNLTGNGSAGGAGGLSSAGPAISGPGGTGGPGAGIYQANGQAIIQDPPSR